MYDHLVQCHANAEMTNVWQKRCQGERNEAELALLSYYMAAVREKEREHMPLIGPTVDRRTLSMVNNMCCDDTVKGMVCFVCAQVHTHVASWNQMWKPPVFVGSEDEMKGSSLFVFV